MLKLLERIWAGIVGALAGASLGFILVMVFLALQISLEIGLWMVAILGMTGGIAGFVFGNKKLGGK
jgi:hypothetical protein